MYNRYIPQPDGSFRRNRIPENQQAPPPVKPDTLPEYHTEKIKQRPCQRPQHNFTQRKPPFNTRGKEETSAISFLRKLLPKEFDTGDLMIVLLLLLMAGDCSEDRNTALLTLALYFFM